MWLEYRFARIPKVALTGNLGLKGGTTLWFEYWFARIPKVALTGNLGLEGGTTLWFEYWLARIPKVALTGNLWLKGGTTTWFRHSWGRRINPTCIFHPTSRRVSLAASGVRPETKISGDAQSAG